MALRLPLKRWYPLTFLFASGAVIFTWRKYATGHQPELLLSGIGALGGFFYFLYRQHLDETKLFNDLFVGFNKRYAEFNVGLNEIRFGGQENDLSKEEKDLLYSYFNLCAEEYLFYKVGYIEHDVWNSWRCGMADFFENLRIRKLWNEEKKCAYYGFEP
jgi:hypothetical protein